MCSAASATVRLTGEEGRPGLAKVGQGARGARGAGGHGQRRGPHPAWRGRIPPSIIHGGEFLAQPCLSFGFARRVVCVCACVCAVSLCTCRAFLLVASRP